MTLTITAPEGAHFDYGEVKTKKGTESLGQAPILVWDNLDKMVEHYGAEGILDVADGTSLRVSFQAVARRGKIAGKSDDEIGTAQIAFKPGKRQGGVSTPKSRARNAAEQAAEKLGGDEVAELLAQLSSGKLSKEDLAALLK